MNILVVGNGGREHAICWKIAQNERVKKIYCAPGNAGTYKENKCENVNILDIDELIIFAKEKNIEITIVGPEVYLVEGIVNRFKREGLRIFGPSKRAAALEGSKAFSKNFMKKYGVKTAQYEVFNEKEKAEEYIDKCEYPIVIKADGLAAGKGVVICNNFNEAKETLEDFMMRDLFKGAGKTIVIEEFLEGVEASILSITDGRNIIPFISAKDHKQILDGGVGANTGGMGVIAPNPYCTEEVIEEFNEKILVPTMRGIQLEAMDYTGIIFFGIMITKKGVYLLEYNVRMGDPETQAVLPLMDSDFLELIEAAMDHRLNLSNIKWSNNSSCCVVATSGGYPFKYNTGFEIKGLESLDEVYFVAGASNIDGRVLTTGGRVLTVTTTGEDIEKARSIAYKELEKISFENMYYRRDIGKII